MIAFDRLLLPAILLVSTLAAGLWVSGAGRPYNSLAFNLHKLVALAAVVFFCIRAAPLLKGLSLPAVVIGLMALLALCVLALFFSGAMLSAGKLDPTLMLRIHQVVPFLLVAGLAAAWFFLNGQKWWG